MAKYRKSPTRCNIRKLLKAVLNKECEPYLKPSLLNCHTPKGKKKTKTNPHYFCSAIVMNVRRCPPHPSCHFAPRGCKRAHFLVTWSQELSSLQILWLETAHLSHKLPGFAFPFHASCLPAWVRAKTQILQSRT